MVVLRQFLDTESHVDGVPMDNHDSSLIICLKDRSVNYLGLLNFLMANFNFPKIILKEDSIKVLSSQSKE